MNPWHVVGRIRDAHGIKGELFVALRAKTADWLPSLSRLGLSERPGEEIKAYDVEEARPHKDGLIVRLKGVLDRNRAESLRGFAVAIPEDYLEASADEPVFLGQLLDLNVVDPKGQILGKIVGLGSNGPQDLIVVANPKGHFDVPLVDDFIEELDLAARRLVMRLPPGLIES